VLLTVALQWGEVDALLKHVVAGMRCCHALCAAKHVPPRAHGLSLRAQAPQHSQAVVAHMAALAVRWDAQVGLLAEQHLAVLQVARRNQPPPRARNLRVPHACGRQCGCP
jgi:hypothetical protein